MSHSLYFESCHMCVTSLLTLTLLPAYTYSPDIFAAYTL